MRYRAWQGVLVVGAFAVAGYFVVPSGAPQGLVYSGIGIASTLCLLWAVRLNRPVERWGWYLIAIANALFVAADGVLDFYDIVLRAVAPFPSVADALYLAGYPFLFAGVFWVRRLRGAAGSREAKADAAMVCIGALALSWQFLMGSYAHDTNLSAFGKFVTMAYPVMDLGVLFIIVCSVTTGSTRRTSDTLLSIAVVLMLAADFIYDLLVLHSGYTAGNPVDALFLANYVVLAAAALHPSMANTLSSSGVRTAPRFWWALVATAGFASPVVLLVGGLIGARVDVEVLASTSIALFALAVVRTGWLFARLRVQTTELRQRSEALHQALDVQQDLERDLRHQAFHDSLTGLANRALLHDRVEHALAASPRLGGTVAVCFCDLDGFKEVNDSLGHRLGDELLILVSKRLSAIVRPGDTVARLGGDEYAILIDNITDVDDVTVLAERIVSVLRQPAEIDGQQIHLSVSVGIAFAGLGTTPETLLSEADAAMYESKALGKGRFTLFENFMRSRIMDRMTLMNAFEGALERAEFFLQYQPQLRLADSSLEGFEALVRWQHPSLGLISPDRFIPLAEETGFIVPLGRWILERACLEAAAWAAPAGTPVSVSVNLSVRQLQAAGLVQDVQNALSFSGLPPECLVLEITESVLMLHPEQTALVLREFKNLGISIAIDDFGTGYSSLSYLRQFPVDIIKIDKSFIDPLQDRTSEGAAFVETILQLARVLHLRTTAEGIEHQIQRDILTRLSCDSAQGYLMSRPLNPDAAHAYIAGRDRTGSCNSDPQSDGHRRLLM